MALIRPQDHPHGMSDALFAELFAGSVDVVFAFHGFPGAIHQLVHGRRHADRFHVRGFIEHGTITTPFDMTVKNRVSRFHLVMDAISDANRTPAGSTELIDWVRGKARTTSGVHRGEPRGHAGDQGLVGHRAYAGVVERRSFRSSAAPRKSRYAHRRRFTGLTGKALT
jgi:phosphoketolase